MTRVLLAGAALCAAGAISQPAQAHFKPGRHNALHAIDKAFCDTYKGCAAGSSAKKIALCETGGTLSPYASNNGVYLGIFQFGPYARATYGFRWNVWSQARSAAKMYSVEGWYPWSCAYLTGVL